MTKYSKNPSVHIDEFGNPHLNIFLHFFYEKDLPKYKPLPTDANAVDERAMVEAMSNTDARGSISHQSQVTSSDWGYQQALLRGINPNEKNPKSNLLKRLFRKYQDKFDKSVPAEEIFKEAKQNMKLPTTEDLEKARESSELLEKFLRDSGQIQQAEKVHTYKEILAGEIILMKNGIDRYLIEDDIIEFMLKAEKGVFIDFLRNFSNILPLEVARKKIDIDKLLVFDNYCVMYYDPTIDPFRKLKDEVVQRKARDPILFGMIIGSNKLYYITDWVYEDDDLTMEAVEKAIGRKARMVQNAKIAETNYDLHMLINGLSDKIRGIYNTEGQPAKL